MLAPKTDAAYEALMAACEEENVSVFLAVNIPAPGEQNVGYDRVVGDGLSIIEGLVAAMQRDPRHKALIEHALTLSELLQKD